MNMNDSSKFLSLLEDFLDYYLPIAKGLSKNTIKSYKYAFRLLIQFMQSSNNIPADQITFEQLNYDTLIKYLEWLEEIRGCCKSTRNQRLAALSSFSKYAQNRNFSAATVFRNSIIKIPAKKSQHSRRAVFTVDEISIFLRLPDESRFVGQRNKMLLSLMYATGARAQEICDLQVKDIIFNDPHTGVTLNGKGGKVRRVFIPKSCSMMLKKYMEKQKLSSSSNSHLFSSQTHEKMTLSCVEEIFKKYVKIAKKKYPNKFNDTSYPPHSMRHTTAVHMVEAGVPLIVIKNFLGHKSLQSTLIYADLTQSTVNKHIKEWNAKWFPDLQISTIKEKDDMPLFLKLK